VTDEPARPRAVTYASRLLYSGAALAVAYTPVLVALHQIGYLPFTVIGVTLLIGLGYYLGKGRNWARIVVWLVAAGVLLNVATLVRLFGDGRYFASRPAWFEPVQIADWALSAAMLITVAILVMLPSARPFFRKVPVTEAA
jgi:hypothetical protein